MKRMRIVGTAATAARRVLLGVGLALSAVALPLEAAAQTATVYGSLSNFDVVNTTGHPAHGFEVELEGVQADQVLGTFTVQRYGAPAIVPYGGGIAVRWTGPYDVIAQQFRQTTVAHAPGTPFAGTCYQWNATTYDAAGCEHFGVALTANPTAVASRWLIADAQAPGALIPVDPPMAVAAPIYSVAPPARPGNPPVLVVEVDAPEPAEAPQLYGPAQWMRVFVTQLPREVALDELMADNPVVPQNATQLESDWSVIQDEPVAGGGGNRRRKRNQGNLDPTTRAVVRRIEMYAYAGAYDPVTNEALCADLTCSAPSPGELGDFISAQMTAANVQSDSVTVAKSGNGTVESTDKRLSCGSKCVAPYDRGTVVTLTARAGSGSTFAGWTGACAGTDPSCAVTATGHVDVTATFALVPTGGGSGGGGGATGVPTLSVKTAGGKGLITGPSAGINCGKTCAASVPSGTAVALAVTPEPGFTFVGWSGACSGAASTCQVIVNGNTSVQATFTK